MAFTIPTLKDLLQEDKTHKCKDKPETCVRIAAVADFPSRFGKFQIVAFYNHHDKREHTAVVRGNVCSQDDVPVRVHSECLTGDTLGSLRCDCRDQLEVALKRLGRMKTGILLYLRQEGRGIGFVNKIKAYQLQDHGYDTIDANTALGFKPDERDYAIAAHMLRSLSIKSIRLMSNNPSKIKDLQKHGVIITGRIPIIVPANKYNSFYLQTKKEKAGHLLGENNTMEQIDELVQRKRK